MLLEIKKMRNKDDIFFARKEDGEYKGEHYTADIVDGGYVKILDAGKQEEADYGMQNNFKIETRNVIK